MELPRFDAVRFASARISGTNSLVLPAALSVGAGGFAFRILSLRGLPNDHYMHLAWAQQILFSEVPGRDFVDPGMPLLYMLSALLQGVWPGPFVEAVLTAGMLSVAASATVILVTRVANLPLGIAAGVLQIALVPRLYSYPKILIPAVAILLFHRYATNVSRGRLMQLSLWTAFAVLLRRDLGLMAALVSIVGLVSLFASDLRRVVATVSGYAAGVIACLIPYLFFVMWTEGLFDNVRDSVEFAKSDAHQFLTALPAFTFIGEGGLRSSWTRTDAAAVLSYVNYLVAALAWIALYVTRPTTDRDARWTTMAVGTIFLSLYLIAILRHPVVARVPDMAGVLSIVAAWLMWLAGRAAGRALAMREPLISAATVGGAGAVAAVLAVTIASVATLGELREKAHDTGVLGGVRNVLAHVQSLAQSGSVWPWPRFWPAGSLPPVVPYLNACTAPSDRVLLTWAAPEYYFFARRPFGSGHALFMPAAFRSPRDQELMIARLTNHRVPIVLINERSREQFAAAYPRLHEYLRSAYAPAGRFDHYDGSEITVAVLRNLKASGAFEPEGWPCGFNEAG